VAFTLVLLLTYYYFSLKSISTCTSWSVCVLQAGEVIELLGLQDMAHTVSTMSQLSLLVGQPVKPVVHQHMLSDFQVSAATFFENKHGELCCWR